MSAFEHLDFAPALILLFLVGRLVLSLLPPGRPGAHVPSEWASTWAASHALGAIVIESQLAWMDELVWWPWLVLGIVRVLILPGAAKPRHEPAPPRIDKRVWIGRGLVLSAILWTGYDRSAVEATSLACLGGLLVEGSRCLRRRPEAGTALAGAWMWTLAALPERVETEALVAISLAAVGSVAWNRRADGRGLALAMAGMVGLGLFDSSALLIALLGPIALVAASAKPSRATAGQFAVGAWLLGGLPLLMEGAPSLEWNAVDPLGSGTAWAFAGLISLRWSQRPSPFAAPHRELWGLGALYLAILVGTGGSQHAISLALPLTFLAVATALPPEKTE